MKSYLTPDHPDAFKDYPKKEIPKGKTECPKCKGHGGWNLEVNTYPNIATRYADTAENRHRYLHFRTMCGACWGFGYLQDGQTCIHEWSASTRPAGRCLHEWTCIHCGKTTIVDSSD